MKKIAVMTSGGDAAGMNAAVRAVVRSAVGVGVEVVGIERGFVGLVERATRPLPSDAVAGILHRGGTMLRTFRCPAFQDRATRDAARAGIQSLGIEGLVVIGGDGSFRGAACIEQEWQIPVIGIPGTIDNDIPGTDYSIGYDTALNVAVDAVDKVRDTATSHGRIFVIEVMGHECGMLALATAICCGAEEVLIPERAYDMDEICRRIERGYDRGKHHAILVVAEGAAHASHVTYEIRGRLKREVRMVVLGHIQRGGTPSAFDRILASRLGMAAVERLVAGEHGIMVGMVADEVQVSPLIKDGAKPHIPLEEFLRIQGRLS